MLAIMRELRVSSENVIHLAACSWKTVQWPGRENHFTADVYIKWSRQRLRPDFGGSPPPPPGGPPAPVLITRGGLRKVQKTANIQCNLQTCEFEDYT